MTRLLCPSMMCADFSRLREETQNLEKGGADIFHIDIMDGYFVPNFGMGLQDFELIRSATDKQVDVHLMIQEPSRYIELFTKMGADILYVHPEADSQITRTLETIKKNGKQAGIAINPGTSIASIQELLSLVDYVMVMTVNPGFAGQSYLSFVNTKIQHLAKLKTEYPFQLMVDGAISPEKIIELSQLGVDGFILGTSALFGKQKSYKEILTDLHSIKK